PGQFTRSEVPAAYAAAQSERLDGAELLVPDGAAWRRDGIPTRELPTWQFDAAAATRALAKHFGTQDLAAFGIDERDLAPRDARARAPLPLRRRDAAGRARACALACRRIGRRIPRARRRDPAQPRDHRDAAR